MTDQEKIKHHYLKSSDNKSGKIIIIGITTVVIFIAVSILLGYVYLWEWVGVVNYENIKTKTLWDWMELLLVPLVLAIGAWWLNKSEKEVELEIAEKRRLEDKAFAKQRATTEREIAIDNQRQNALESYFDRMTSLLLDYDLRESERADDEVRSVARSRTLTTLRSLDGKRKGQLVRFLYESELLKGEDPLINLAGADLRNVDLRGADLLLANMRGVDFQYADLREANLRGVDLWRADFSKANLSKANLSGAHISEVLLFDADLSQSILGGADLSASVLIQTNLRGAILHNTDIGNDSLRVANLYFAKLEGANLEGAIVTVEQLQGLLSIENTIMMDGQPYHDWAKEHSFQLKSRLENEVNEKAV